MRKIAALLDDEHFGLLERNEILGVGRNSKFSNWLRTKILEDFGDGNLDTLILDKKTEINKLERDKVEVSHKIDKVKRDLLDLERKELDMKKGKEKLRQFNLTKQQIINFNTIKFQINQGETTLLSAWRNGYNQDFPNFNKFKEIIEKI